MPSLFTDVIRRQLVEGNDYVKFAGSGKDAKTVAQPLLQGEFVRPDEGRASGFNLQNSRRDKSADVVAQMAMGKKKPFTVNVGQVIRVNDARLGLFSARLAISQFELFVLGSRLGEGVEDL